MIMIHNKNIKQFISYLFVGAIATLVEWVGFWILNGAFKCQYLWATAIAFTISTEANLMLGRRLTFKDECTEQIEIKESISIYLASLFGLALNLLLMYLLVSKIYMPKFLSKVIATGIVFFWNFGIRKFGIYAKK